MNFSGLETSLNSVIDIAEVFDANIASLLICDSSSLNKLNLISLFSKIASTTSSTSAGISVILESGCILSKVFFLSESLIISFLIWRSKFFDIVSIPFLSNSGFKSHK